MQPVLCSARLAEYGFSHGFSMRSPPHDDFGTVAENQRFAAAVGFAPERLFMLTQVHGREVRVVHTGDTPATVRAEQGDGLVGWGGLAVAVRTADCLPVLLADPHTRSVAAVHAGWRGCVVGVIEAGVRALCTVASSPPERLVVGFFSAHSRVLLRDR